MKIEIKRLKQITNISFSIILVAAVIVIIYNPEWILGDDLQFLSTTAIGKFFYCPIRDGRFWPLGLVDYSILLCLPFELWSTITSYLAYNCVTLVIGCILTFNLLKKLTRYNYLASIWAIVVLFCSASFLRIHMTCIFAERTLFFLFSLFSFFLWKAELTNKTKYYVCAFIAAVYATYAKEPVFGALMIIALTRLVFGAKSLSSKSKLFHWGLIVNSVVYITIYCFIYFGYSPSRMYGYNWWANIKFLDLILLTIKYDPILLFVILLAPVRFFFVCFKSDKNHLFLDSLLFAGFGYWCAIVLLHILSDHYTGPAIFLAIPSVGYWLHKLAQKIKRIDLCCVLIVLCIPMFDGFYTSYLRVQEIHKFRERDMPIIRYLSNRIQNNTKTKIRMLLFDEVSLWEYKVFKEFLEFSTKRQEVPLKIIHNLDELDSDTIVLYPISKQPLERFTKHPKAANFHLHAFTFGTCIYVPN